MHPAKPDILASFTSTSTSSPMSGFIPTDVRARQEAIQRREQNRSRAREEDNLREQQLELLGSDFRGHHATPRIRLESEGGRSYDPSIPGTPGDSTHSGSPRSEDPRARSESGMESILDHKSRSVESTTPQSPSAPMASSPSRPASQRFSVSEIPAYRGNSRPSSPVDAPRSTTTPAPPLVTDLPSSPPTSPITVKTPAGLLARLSKNIHKAPSSGPMSPPTSALDTSSSANALHAATPSAAAPAKSAPSTPPSTSKETTPPPPSPRPMPLDYPSAEEATKNNNGPNSSPPAVRDAWSPSNGKDEVKQQSEVKKRKTQPKPLWEGGELVGEYDATELSTIAEGSERSTHISLISNRPPTLPSQSPPASPRGSNFGSIGLARRGSADSFSLRRQADGSFRIPGSSKPLRDKSKEKLAEQQQQRGPDAPQRSSSPTRAVSPDLLKRLAAFERVGAGGGSPTASRVFPSHGKGEKGKGSDPVMEMVREHLRGSREPSKTKSIIWSGSLLRPPAGVEDPLLQPSLWRSHSFALSASALSFMDDPRLPEFHFADFDQVESLPDIRRSRAERDDTAFFSFVLMKGKERRELFAAASRTERSDIVAELESAIDTYREKTGFSRALKSPPRSSPSSKSPLSDPTVVPLSPQIDNPPDASPSSSRAPSASRVAALASKFNQEAAQPSISSSSTTVRRTSPPKDPPPVPAVEPTHDIELEPPAAESPRPRSTRSSKHRSTSSSKTKQAFERDTAEATEASLVTAEMGASHCPLRSPSTRSRPRSEEAQSNPFDLNDFTEEEQEAGRAMAKEFAYNREFPSPISEAFEETPYGQHSDLFEIARGKPSVPREQDKSRPVSVVSDSNAKEKPLPSRPSSVYNNARHSPAAHNRGTSVDSSIAGAGLGSKSPIVVGHTRSTTEPPAATTDVENRPTPRQSPKKSPTAPLVGAPASSQAPPSPQMAEQPRQSPRVPLHPGSLSRSSPGNRSPDPSRLIRTGVPPQFMVEMNRVLAILNTDDDEVFEAGPEGTVEQFRRMNLELDRVKRKIIEEKYRLANMSTPPEDEEAALEDFDNSIAALSEYVDDIVNNRESPLPQDNTGKMYTLGVYRFNQSQLNTFGVLHPTLARLFHPRTPAHIKLSSSGHPLFPSTRRSPPRPIHARKPPPPVTTPAPNQDGDEGLTAVDNADVKSTTTRGLIHDEAEERHWKRQLEVYNEAKEEAILSTQTSPRLNPPLDGVSSSARKNIGLPSASENTPRQKEKDRAQAVRRLNGDRTPAESASPLDPAKLDFSKFARMGPPSSPLRKLYPQEETSNSAPPTLRGAGEKEARPLSHGYEFARPPHRPVLVGAPPTSRFSEDTSKTHPATSRPPLPPVRVNHGQQTEKSLSDGGRHYPQSERTVRGGAPPTSSIYTADRNGLPREVEKLLQVLSENLERQIEMDVSRNERHNILNNVVQDLVMYMKSDRDKRIDDFNTLVTSISQLQSQLESLPKDLLDRVLAAEEEHEAAKRVTPNNDDDEAPRSERALSVHSVHREEDGPSNEFAGSGARVVNDPRKTAVTEVVEKLPTTIWGTKNDTVRAKGPRLPKVIFNQRIWGAPEPTDEARARWGGSYNPKAANEKAIKEALEKDAADAEKEKLGPTMTEAIKHEAFVKSIEGLINGELDPASIGVALLEVLNTTKQIREKQLEDEKKEKEKPPGLTKEEKIELAAKKAEIARLEALADANNALAEKLDAKLQALMAKGITTDQALAAIKSIITSPKATEMDPAISDTMKKYIAEMKDDVANQVKEFRNQLTNEVQRMYGEVGKLRDEKKNLQGEIADLMAFQAKYGGQAPEKPKPAPVTATTTAPLPNTAFFGPRAPRA